MVGPTVNGSCLAKVQAGLANQSRTAQQIGRFLLRSPVEARDMSISALAEACGVSTAMVSRFSRSLGYRGFKEFQMDLATAVAQSEAFPPEDFGPGATPEVIIRQVFECNRQSLAETERMVDHQVLIRVARLIRDADRVLLLGIGGSALVARECAQRFLSLGLTALTLEDPYFQIFATSDVGRRDVVMGISHTGQTAPVVESTEQARRRGARTVALTNYPQSPLAAAAEFPLITAYREHRVNAAVSSSRIAQMCVIDSLYFVIGSWSRARAKRLADQAEQRTRKLLRTRTARRP